MMHNKCLLTIVAEAGASISVRYRDRGDDPPPPVFDGHVGPEGGVTITVPCAYLVVLSPGCETAIADLREGADETVHLLKR